MAITDPALIRFVIKNTPDPKTGVSRGYTIGYLNGGKEIVPDNIGDKIALVMEERGKKEYKGQLVTPRGDPLNEVMGRARGLDVAGIDDRVVKKSKT